LCLGPPHEESVVENEQVFTYSRQRPSTDAVMLLLLYRPLTRENAVHAVPFLLRFPPHCAGHA